MEKKSLTCIICPLGCRVQVQISSRGEVEGVEGQRCKKGEKYANEEAINPTRTLTTTVAIDNAPLPRLPVKTGKPVPRELIMSCMERLNEVVATAPVKEGEIIINNILDTGIDVVATRSMPL